MSRLTSIIACILVQLATPAFAAPTGALKARVGWSANGAVDSLQSDEGQDGVGLAMSPVHAAAGGFLILGPHLQVGAMASYGRFLDHGEGGPGVTTEAISLLPTLRLVSGLEGVGAYGEFGLGYSYLSQRGDAEITSHGWQTQLEGGVSVALADGLLLELGIALGFRVGGNMTVNGPTGSAAFGFDAPDLRAGLSYAL